MRVRIWLVAALAMSAVPAVARAQVLNFEGIGSTTVQDDPFILNFYNGGMASNGVFGPNLGITFSANAIELCLNTLTNLCSNTSRGGLAPTSQFGALDYLTGTSAFMTRAAGFTTGFSFLYTDPFATGGSFTVYDGVDGTGNVLASLSLGLTPDGATACPGYNANFCPFVAAGVAFAGTAKSVVFSGVADQVLFDDVTFGSVTPGDLGGSPVPEPASLGLMATGLVGLVAAAGRRRRRARVS